MLRRLIRPFSTLRDPKAPSFSPLENTGLSNYISPYATSYPSQVTVPQGVPVRRPYERLVTIRKLMRVSSKGKHMRYDAWCMAGDRNGSIGIASATSTQANKAVNLAMKRARKSMKHFDLFEGRTIHHDLDIDYYGLRMKLLSKPAGYSVRAQHNIYDFCQAIGIQDLAAKIIVGSTNPITIVKGMLRALEKQHKVPKEISVLRGKKEAEL